MSYFVAKSRQSYWHILELIKGVVLEQLYIVEVHWSSPLALLCKVQRLPLAKQTGYTFKEAQNSSKHILYSWLSGVGCDILSSPHFQHHLYFILITVEAFEDLCLTEVLEGRVVWYVQNELTCSDAFSC